MITAIRVELLKLRTTRLWLGLLGAAVGLNALVATVTSSKSGSGGSMSIPSLSTANGLKAVITSTGFSLLIAMACGAIIATSEFRNQTITDTYLDEPKRSRVLIAKLVAAFIAGCLIGGIATSVTIGIALTFVASKGFALVVATKTIIGIILGGTLASGLLAMFGVAIGTLIRSQIASIIAIFVWGFGIEQVLGGLSSHVAPYLPYTAAVTMAGAKGGEGMPQLPTGLSPLPFIGATGLLVGLIILTSMVAAYAATRQDVS